MCPAEVAEALLRRLPYTVYQIGAPPQSAKLRVEKRQFVPATVRVTQCMLKVTFLGFGDEGQRPFKPAPTRTNGTLITPVHERYHAISRNITRYHTIYTM